MTAHHIFDKLDLDFIILLNQLYVIYYLASGAQQQAADPCLRFDAELHPDPLAELCYIIPAAFLNMHQDGSHVFRILDAY